jgi:LmbE family N-acetylglucosaminyl deacetylase
MTVSVDLSRPARVLAIGAHPDDIEFGCGATLAKWADAGAEVHLCICTDGAKGTWDPTTDVGELVARREAEQRDAAAALGAVNVRFLRFTDGELASGLTERAKVCAAIRRVQPDVVLGHDPWRAGGLHPDHRHGGRLAVEGIVAARDPHFFPEQGLAPHRPSALLLFETDRVNHVERVDGYVERKVEALLRHRSQWRSTLGIDANPEIERARFEQGLHDEAQAAGIRAGVRAAEPFHRMNQL